MSILKEIEAIKTVMIPINTYGVNLETPLLTSIYKAQYNINFIPDFVKVKQVSYIDTTDSSGSYTVNCNFIMDNDILVSFNSLSIIEDVDSSDTYTGVNINPEILHRFIPTLNFVFTVSTILCLNAPSPVSSLILTLEFIKYRN